MGRGGHRLPSAACLRGAAEEAGPRGLGPSRSQPCLRGGQPISGSGMEGANPTLLRVLVVLCCGVVWCGVVWCGVCGCAPW